jgi:hypothetical protein
MDQMAVENCNIISTKESLPEFEINDQRAGFLPSIILSEIYRTKSGKVVYPAYTQEQKALYWVLDRQRRFISEISSVSRRKPSLLPELGYLAGDCRKVPVFIPYLAVGLEESAGDEAGPEAASEPVGPRQVSHVYGELDRGHPGGHALGCQGRGGHGIDDQKQREEIDGAAVGKTEIAHILRKVRQVSGHPACAGRVEPEIEVMKKGVFGQRGHRHAFLDRGKLRGLRFIPMNSAAIVSGNKRAESPDLLPPFL